MSDVLRGVRDALLRGLKPSLVSLLLAALIAAILLGVSVIALHLGWHWRLDKQLVLPDPANFHAANAWNIERIRVRDNRKPYYVLLTGGSAIRRSLFDIESLSSRLTEKIGFPVEVINLGANSQGFAHVIAMLERLGRRAKGLLILGVSPARFDKGSSTIYGSQDGTQGLIHSNLVKDFLRELGFRFEPHSLLARYAPSIESYMDTRLQLFLDPEQYCAVNAGAGFHAVCRRYYIDSGYTNRLKVWLMRDVRPDAIQRYPQGFLEYAWQATRNIAVENYWTHKALNVEQFALIVRLARLNGLDIVLSEQPTSAYGWSAWAPIHADYDNLLNGLVQDYGLEYWNDNGAGSFLEENDFVDLIHLSPTGKQKFQAALERRLVTRLVARPLRHKRESSEITISSLARWHALLPDGKFMIEETSITAEIGPWHKGYQLESDAIPVDPHRHYSIGVFVALSGPSQCSLGLLNQDRSRWIAHKRLERSGEDQFNALAFDSVDSRQVFMVLECVDPLPEPTTVRVSVDWRAAPAEESSPFALRAVQR